MIDNGSVKLSRLEGKLSTHKFECNPLKWEDTFWGWDRLPVRFVETDKWWFFKFRGNIYAQDKAGEHFIKCYGCEKPVEFLIREIEIAGSLDKAQVIGEFEVPYCKKCDKGKYENV
ncbi:MAG TPA: hypothetical protein VJI68_02635 [Candidatus Nanoarchaeia archaeon]|nr:hypothetical protein [Candidatus Nanoarchaeia archaeon]